MNFYKVQTGFQIVDSNGVPGTPVDGISTTLTDSVSKIPTDKAVKDAIESAIGEIEDVSISKDVITAYGDLVVGNASGEPDTLHKGTNGQVLTTAQNGLEWKSGISTASAFVEATGSTPLNLSGNDVLTTANVNIVNTADGYFSVSTDKTASGYASTLSLGTSGFVVNSSSYNTQSSSGPTTLQSSGGAPVTVKSNGSASDHSDIVLTPNTGTISVNASTANHTLSMYSKSVVSGNTSYAQLDLNDSSGAEIHTNASTIKFTSEGGAPITTKVIGDVTHYSTIESQVTQVRLMATADSPTNFTVNGSGSTSSISGSAKNITMLAAMGPTDTGTASFSAGAINGTTTISGSIINLVGAPNGSMTIGSTGISLISPTLGITNSAGSYSIYTPTGKTYATANEMELESTTTLTLKADYDSTSQAYLDTLVLGDNGVSLTSPSSIVIDAQGGSNHAILKSTSDDGQGGTYTVGLDVYQGGATLSSNAGPINISNTGSTVNISSLGSTSISAAAVSISATGNNSNAILETTVAASHTIVRNVSDDGEGGTYTVGLDVYQGGATLSSQAGPINLLTDQASINITSTSAPINILSPAGAPIALRSALMSGSTYSANIQLTGSVSISSPGGTVGISSIGPTSLLSTQGNITLDTTVGEIKISSNGGAPITSKVTGDSTHYTTVTENVTGLSVSVAGASSPTSLAMSGNDAQGTSNITVNAKNIGFYAAQLPSDTTGSPSLSLGVPPYGSIVLNSNGVSLIAPSLPTSITTPELILPGYNNTFDSTTTHKVMVHAASDGGVELAGMSDLTNEQFGLDSTTVSGSMFVVEQVGDPGEEEPSISILPPGTQGQVLTIGSSGVEWATLDTGTDWYCGSFTTANRPANPSEGQYGYDTTIDCVIYYIGGYWKNSAGAIV